METTTTKPSTIRSRLEDIMVGRASKLAERRDHFPAHPVWAIVSLAAVVSKKAERDAVYAELDENIMRAMATRGLVAEIYVRRADLGNGAEDGRMRVRIQAREGVPTRVERVDNMMGFHLHHRVASTPGFPEDTLV